MSKAAILKARTSRESLTLFLLLLSLMTLVLPTAAQEDNAPLRSHQTLESAVLNQNLPLEKRISALKQLMGDEMVDGKLPRQFCVWDPLGKTGPIAAAARDQILRSLHYGMQLTIKVYQNEDVLISQFMNEPKCDAILIRGSKAHAFNAFMATTEAPGAFPEREHLQLLTQVLANPAIAGRLANPKYTALGLVTIGTNRLYTSSTEISSLTDMRGLSIGLTDNDSGSDRLAQAMNGRVRSADLATTIDAFANDLTQAMIAPDIAYLAMGNGRLSDEAQASSSAISQSTLQLIGHTDRFPPGLAQILREDFLFKFSSYARVLDRELSNIPDTFWRTFSEQDEAQLEKLSQKTRLALRDEGYYDRHMLKLARKIRCRFSPDVSECINTVE